MDPLTAYQQGGWMALAVLLFLTNFVQNYGIKKSNETLVEAVKQSNDAAVATNNAIAAQLTEMALTLAAGHAKLAEGLTAVIQQQEILAVNQLNLTKTNNQIVRELITIIRDGERG